ncbi:hypothetical protein SAMN05444389_102446 [Paracoccus solventivorans]|uniref:Uncharacterized protein n=1 Tax=Paracoccus solventivorans TaxID=53463 RepID=A0A1M7F101_9RHOB|nr:hypothetical protein [Paracoccus solventivorans]SHL97408.1 hypothetical protein SAMN05444389_102446 [Paracoccus solventivorans]
MTAPRPHLPAAPPTTLPPARDRRRGRRGALLGHEVHFPCWPFDRRTPAARHPAEAAGFQRFTGGRGKSRRDEDPDMLSRVHVHDRACGGGPLWLETPRFRARLGAMSGNLYRTPGLMADALPPRCRSAAPGGHE